MQEITLTTVAGVKMRLRFDIGTARTLKDLTGIDIIAGDALQTDPSVPPNIFLACYKRGCTLYKKEPELTDEECLESYYELTTGEVVKIINLFRDAISGERTKDDAAGDELKNA